MSWYCKICSKRQIKCLGSDPKGCIMPAVTGIHVVADYIVPCAMAVAWYLVSDSPYATGGAILVIYTILKLHKVPK